MRAAIYNRVSTEMQLDGYSLDAQLTVCRRLIAERGWQEVAVYTDRGISAKTTARPKFRALMRDAKAGRFNVVIVHKLDRLSRSVVDLLTTLHELEALEVALVSSSEQFDFTTPMGRVMLTMLAAFAQWYLDNLSAETAKGKRARAEAGLWNGGVPFGYQVDYKKDGGDGLAYLDEKALVGAHMTFELATIVTRSNADIARELNEAGYRPRGRGGRALELFSKDTVASMLKNRFYLGEVQYKGEWYKGVHEPIISEELFNQVQEARHRRRRKGGYSATKMSRVYPMTGVARCARCGTRMRGANSAGYRYYRDPARDKGLDCDQRMVASDKTEDALGDFLHQLPLPKNWQDRVLGMIQERVGTQRDVARERARIDGQLARLMDLYKLGDVAKEEYLVERDGLRAQFVALTPPAMPDLEWAAELLRDFGRIWDAATLKERQEIVPSLLENVYLDAEVGPVVAIEPRAEFSPLFEAIAAADKYDSETEAGIVILPPGVTFSL